MHVERAIGLFVYKHFPFSCAKDYATQPHVWQLNTSTGITSFGLPLQPDACDLILLDLLPGASKGVLRNVKILCLGKIPADKPLGHSQCFPLHQERVQRCLRVFVLPFQGADTIPLPGYRCQCQFLAQALESPLCLFDRRLCLRRVLRRGICRRLVR